MATADVVRTGMCVSPGEMVRWLEVHNYQESQLRPNWHPIPRGGSGSDGHSVGKKQWLYFEDWGTGYRPVNRSFTALDQDDDGSSLLGAGLTDKSAPSPHRACLLGLRVVRGNGVSDRGIWLGGKRQSWFERVNLETGGLRRCDRSERGQLAIWGWDVAVKMDGWTIT